MNRLTDFLCFAFLFISTPLFLNAQQYQNMILDGSYTLTEIQEAAEKHFDVVGRGRGTGYKQWKRWEFNAELSRKADGTVRSQAEKLAALEAFNQSLNQHGAQALSTCESNWTAEGPTSVNVTSGYNPGIGRVTSLGVHPSDSATIIVGAHTGGVWKTTDLGGTWTSITEEFVNLDVRALEIAPSNPNFYYWGSSSNTLYRSMDAGATWVPVTTPARGGIQYIAIDEENPEIYWIASSISGIYRTEDGGTTWDNLGNSVHAYDIEFHPTIDSIMYVAGSGGFWKSVDYGKSFRRGASPGGNDVAMLSVTPADPDRIYMLTSPGGRRGGIYRSQDQGETWEEMDPGGPNYLGYSSEGADGSGQAPRDMDIVASPTDSNLVFISGINLWKSEDGGNTYSIYSHWVYNPFGATAYTHADIDITKIVDDKLYVGSDGGIYLLDDLNKPVSFESIQDLSEGLNIHQIYRIGLAQSQEKLIACGAQDNGSSLKVEGTWNNYFGADGMDCVVMDDAQNTVFGMFQFGGLLRSDDKGQSTSFFSANGLDVIREGAWVTPMTKTEDSLLLVGYDHVYWSDNLGDDFFPISQRFGEPGIVREIEVAESNPEIIYCILSTDQVYRTTDYGDSDWELLQTEDEGINSIAIHPQNPDLIAIASRVSLDVIISRDAGETWEVFDGLPRLAPRALVWQNDGSETLYAGLEYGIFKMSLTEDTEWQLFNRNLPNVTINDLEINEETGILYAASYGRGLWSSPICSPLVANEDDIIIDDINVFPNPAKDQFTIQTEQQLSGNLRIFDAAGRVVYRQMDLNSFNGVTINTEFLAAGQYYLRFTATNGIIVKPLQIIR